MSNSPAPVAHLTRCYAFSASHRLHSSELSDGENQRIYGKCNNPWGHGHNYRLEVTVSGPVNAATGMVMNLVDLDRLVKEEVLDPLDHTNLNLDVPCFHDRVPTSENLLLEIAGRLDERWNRESSREARGAAKLTKLRLQETGKNFFEYQLP
jgi:6-pyruvoyltetrahydropterin/6-carboxytetrahydropterin synthase